MPKPQFITTSQGRQIAYHHHDGAGPAVVFLGGFMSDMNGTKAVHLQNWARAQKRAFLRFDYSGHGQSSGTFTDGTIGAWADDAAEIIAALMRGPVVLVGSSMGGWISLLLARRAVVPIVGFVGIAAAPDFTQDSIWADMTGAQRDALLSKGVVELPSDYDNAYPITRALIEEGRDNLVLRQPLHLPFRVRLLHGSADKDVPISRPLALLEHAKCDDLRLIVVKGADHRFSNPQDLDLIVKTVDSITDS